ncbi:MAG TPA: carbohydrate binding domain-containing protein [Anaerolineae bacterium]|nr:carbohydrate binding domain-containing protein [Anaerolineae bacterium]
MRPSSRNSKDVHASVSDLADKTVYSTHPARAGLAPAIGPDKLADFEAGEPGGWFVYNGEWSSVSTSVLTVGDVDPLARPAQAGDNGVLEAGFSISDYGGFGQALAATGSPQDWSTHDGFSFWFYGTGSGFVYQAEISDNRSDPNLDTSERFDYEFTDDTPGWRRIFIPWSDFSRATDFQPDGAPEDGLTLTEMWAYAIALPSGTSGTFYLDDVALMK